MTRKPDDPPAVGRPDGPCSPFRAGSVPDGLGLLDIRINRVRGSYRVRARIPSRLHIRAHTASWFQWMHHALDAVREIVCDRSDEHEPGIAPFVFSSHDPARVLIPVAWSGRCRMGPARPMPCSTLPVRRRRRCIYQADPVFPWRRSLSGIDNLLGFARARYDEGKRAAEVLIHDMIRMHGIDTMIARIFNT